MKPNKKKVKLRDELASKVALTKGALEYKAEKTGLIQEGRTWKAVQKAITFLIIMCIVIVVIRRVV